MRFCLLASLLLLIPLSADAQQIPIKTHPVIDGAQFELYPSDGTHASFLLNDDLADPFRNPAMGSLRDGHAVALSPTYYHRSGYNMDGRRSSQTVPVAGFFRGERVFANAMVAGQRLTFPQVPHQRVDGSVSRENAYGALNVGYDVPGTDLAVGAGLYGATLNGMEGLDQIRTYDDVYAFSGHQLDFRLGGYYEAPSGMSADLVVSHFRQRLSSTWVSPMRIYDPRALSISHPTNRDYSDQWNIETTYKHPIAENWTAGLNLALHYRDHLHYPRSEFTWRIFDDGHSLMSQLGAGALFTPGSFTFSADVAYQPGVAHVNALVPTAADEPIFCTQWCPPHEYRDESYDFNFRNGFARLGAAYDGGNFSLSAGTTLRQARVDHNVTQPDAYDRWNEMLASLGASYDLGRVTLQYQLSAHFGSFNRETSTRRIILAQGTSTASFSNEVIADPWQSLHSYDGMAQTHRLQLIVPIGQ